MGCSTLRYDLCGTLGIVGLTAVVNVVFCYDDDSPPPSHPHPRPARVMLPLLMTSQAVQVPMGY